METAGLTKTVDHLSGADHPYMLDYDMVVLAPALLFLIRNSLKFGFEPYERLGIALVWFAPILTRQAAQYLAIPVGPLAMICLFILIVHKAIRQTSADAMVPGKIPA